MRKIGIGSGSYIKDWDTDLNEAFRLMKFHGFDCVDLRLMTTEPSPKNIYDKDDAKFESILRKLKDAAENAGIEIYQAHGPWRYPPKDATAEDRAEWRAYMEKGMYACSMVGCKYFVVHPIMPFGTGAAPDNEIFYKLNYEFFKSLIPTAKKYGVIVCVENMPFRAQSLARPNEIADFVKDLDSDSICACLDTGHAAVLGFDCGESVKIMKDKLVTLHVHDNDGAKDLHQFPFDGTIDWTSFANALKDIDENVVLTLETSASRDREDWDDKQKELADRAKKIINLI